MKKIYALLAVVLIVVFVTSVSAMSVFTVYLPLVRGPIPTSETPGPGITPTTPAAPSDPVLAGSVIHILGWEKEVRLSGVVVRSEFQQTLAPDYGSPVTAQGKFLVVVLDVTNQGLQSDSVGSYSSFRAKDAAGREFDLAGLTVQMAAKDQYNLGGIYTTVQPGFTTQMVFVFDVLPAAQTFTLVSLSPW